MPSLCVAADTLLETNCRIDCLVDAGEFAWTSLTGWWKDLRQSAVCRGVSMQNLGLSQAPWSEDAEKGLVDATSGERDSKARLVAMFVVLGEGLAEAQ